MKQTKEMLLLAAARVIRERGVAALTLEAVAAEAKVSKGGLLYHYPSKDALIAAMIQYLIADFSSGIARYLASGDNQPGAWLRAYIHATFTNAGDEGDEVLFGLLAAVSTNPELLEPLRKAFDEWQAQTIAAGVDPALATILRLAVDGLWLSEMMNLGRLDDDLRRQVLARMLALTHPNDKA